MWGVDERMGNDVLHRVLWCVLLLGILVGIGRRRLAFARGSGGRRGDWRWIVPQTHGLHGWLLLLLVLGQLLVDILVVLDDLRGLGLLLDVGGGGER